MKGCNVILALVTLGLIVAQTQVEATTVCCPSNSARNCYNACRLPGTPQPVCASACNCIIITGSTCPRPRPPGYPRTNPSVALAVDEGMNDSSTWNVMSTSAPSDITRYCKLGCASSMCSQVSTPQISTGGRVDEDEEVVSCNKACSYICTKSSTTA